MKEHEIMKLQNYEIEMEEILFRMTQSLSSLEKKYYFSSFMNL
jgi:hypothetical protein